MQIRKIEGDAGDWQACKVFSVTSGSGGRAEIISRQSADSSGYGCSARCVYGFRMMEITGLPGGTAVRRRSRRIKAEVSQSIRGRVNGWLSPHELLIPNL
jgi:hypothetical protein